MRGPAEQVVRADGSIETAHVGYIRVREVRATATWRRSQVLSPRYGQRVDVIASYL